MKQYFLISLISLIYSNIISAQCSEAESLKSMEQSFRNFDAATFKGNAKEWLDEEKRQLNRLSANSSNNECSELVKTCSKAYENAKLNFDTYNNKIQTYYTTKLNLNFAQQLKHVDNVGKYSIELEKIKSVENLIQERKSFISSHRNKNTNDELNSENIRYKYQYQKDKKLKSVAALQKLTLQGLPTEFFGKFATDYHLTYLDQTEFSYFLKIKYKEKIGLIELSNDGEEKISIIALPIYDEIDFINLLSNKIEEIDFINNEFKTIHKHYAKVYAFKCKVNNKEGLIDHLGNYICLPLFDSIKYLTTHIDSLNSFSCDDNGECREKALDYDSYFAGFYQNNSYCIKFKEHYYTEIFPLKKNNYTIDNIELSRDELNLKMEEFTQDFFKYKSKGNFGISDNNNLFYPPLFSELNVLNETANSFKFREKDLIGFVVKGNQLSFSGNEEINLDEEISVNDPDNFKPILLKSDNQYWVNSFGPLTKVTRIETARYELENEFGKIYVLFLGNKMELLKN